MGRKLMSLWMGEAKKQELYTAACSLYISIYFILQYLWEESWCHYGWEKLKYMSYTQQLVVYTFIYTYFQVFMGRKLMSLWMGEAKIYELYTAACGLYISIYFILQYSCEESWCHYGWKKLKYMSYTQQLVVYTFLYTLFFSIHVKKADVTMDGRR